MPAPTSEDQQFMGLTQLSEEELMGIEGNVVTSYADGASNITITGIKKEKKVTITVSIGISSTSGIQATGTGIGVSSTSGIQATGTGIGVSSTSGINVGVQASTTNTSGYSSNTDPNTGITTVTYTWTQGNTTYTMTWQVNENGGTYSSATTSTSTHQSGWSDAGASKPN